MGASTGQDEHPLRLRFTPHCFPQPAAHFVLMPIDHTGWPLLNPARHHTRLIVSSEGKHGFIVMLAPALNKVDVHNSDP